MIWPHVYIWSSKPERHKARSGRAKLEPSWPWTQWDRLGRLQRSPAVRREEVVEETFTEHKLNMGLFISQLFVLCEESQSKKFQTAPCAARRSFRPPTPEATSQPAPWLWRWKWHPAAAPPPPHCSSCEWCPAHQWKPHWQCLQSTSLEGVAPWGQKKIF